MRKASREMDAAFALEVLDKAPYVTVSMTRPYGIPYGLPLPGHTKAAFPCILPASPRFARMMTLRYILTWKTAGLSVSMRLMKHR